MLRIVCARDCGQGIWMTECGAYGWPTLRGEFLRQSERAVAR